MNRKEFLNDDRVDRFVQWMAARLDTNDFTHTWIDRRTHGQWACKSLYNAFELYKWSFSVPLNTDTIRGETFEDSTNILGQISTGIREAVSVDNDHDTLFWSLAVMRWGGVFPGNGNWLEERVEDLAQRIRNNAGLLFSIETEEDDLADIDRFNSGFSKIYSLLGDGFVIYDSRVAAALGWIVRRYCEENDLDEVPCLLRFPHGAAREYPGAAHPKIRDPSLDGLQFPPLRQGACHAWANLRASWVLSSALEQNPDSRFHEQENPLRALEAALFMIGYDLGGDGNNPPGVEGRPPGPGERGIPEDDGSGWDGAFFRLETRGGNRRRRKFGYRVTEQGLKIKNVNGRMDFFPYDEIFKILQSVQKQFGKEWFPLANNVQLLGNGMEKPGLGRTILALKPGKIAHAQASSYLGRVLEDIGLAVWNRRRRGIQWRLIANAPTSVAGVAATLKQQQEP